MGKRDLARLLASVKSCATVDDLKAAMEAEGVWLNDQAAAAVFKAVEGARARDAALADVALAGVSGGVAVEAAAYPAAAGPADAEEDRALLDLLGTLIVL